ncbi:MAG TPA: DUF6265 family protein [Candidatus Baltobacteraceae bacterium]|nr:DUF6265 family protein [Candidatus Baltobacteraceae bacterium]
MAVPKILRADVCLRACIVCALLVLIPALGLRAQDAQGAGAVAPSAATDPPAAPHDATPAPVNDSSPAPPAPAPKATKPPVASPSTAAQAKPSLADFAWLVGRWQGAWGPRVAQQVWMPAKGGVMLGMFQTVDNGDTLVLELFALVEKPDGINLYIRHFTPTLEPWETSKATMLKLVGATPKGIEFDNPLNGQPKRQIIRRADADTYVSRAEIMPGKGDPQVVEITYRRQKDATAAKH